MSVRILRQARVCPVCGEKFKPNNFLSAHCQKRECFNEFMNGAYDARIEQRKQKLGRRS
jgi:hypothetical protein